MNKINLLSIDPALNNLGLALLAVDTENLEIDLIDIHLARTDNQSGKTVRKNSDDLRRARELLAAVRDFEARAHIAVAEVPTGTQSARGAMSNGICIGVLAALTLPLIEVSPSETKMISVGRKTATKEEVIDWAHKLYPHARWLTKKRKGVVSLTADNEHMADAVAAGHAGIKTEQFKAALQMFKAMHKENKITSY